jgi:hypothetical protein
VGVAPNIPVQILSYTTDKDSLNFSNSLKSEKLEDMLRPARKYVHRAVVAARTTKQDEEEEEVLIRGSSRQGF